MLPLNQIWSSIDLNVILMIASTMGLVSVFVESKMPALLADLIMERVPNVKWAAVALALFAGIISAISLKSEFRSPLPQQFPHIFTSGRCMEYNKNTRASNKSSKN